MFENSPTGVLYADYVRKMWVIADIRNATALMDWDQETYLPPAGAPFRSRQVSTLNSLGHELISATAFGDLLRALCDRKDLEGIPRSNAELSLKDHERARRYSPALVASLSEQTHACFHAWIGARQSNTFADFGKSLEILLALKWEEAEVLGYEDHPYDALLDEFDRGSRTSRLDPLLARLRDQLVPMVKESGSVPRTSDEFLHRIYPREAQWSWGLYLLGGMGFDWQAGRQDISEHPFTTSFCCRDVRLTTRIDEGDFRSMTWSCLHEGGHGLYEQGLPEEEYGLPAGEAASLSIHESQSRLWENQVGRSLDYWVWYYPRLQERFPIQLGGVGLEEFYHGINRVGPSLIRTQADELTYHLHIMIRYQIEKELMDRRLRVRELPERWRQDYSRDLGLEVPDELRGVLQDVHWSHGSFGYFPTYTLGSLYAAQFFEQAARDIPDLDLHLRSGQSRPLLDWLRKGIHGRGRLLSSEDLCRELCGRGLDPDCFIRYARTKFRGENPGPLPAGQPLTIPDAGTTGI